MQSQGDIDALLAKPQNFPFDAEVPLVTLDTSHVISVLDRFLQVTSLRLT